jgi:hypothetical protein
MSTTFHFVSAHKRVGPLRKEIGLADGTNRSYPLAGKVTVHEEKLDLAEAGVEGYRELLLNHAAEGHALYKGLMTKLLKHESRRGMTDKEARTEFLVLDVDGLDMDVKIGKPATSADVQRVADMVIQMLPAALHETSYVAVASSSFGLDKTKQSVHIHFLLKNPIAHRALKQWLDGVNYTQNDIYEKLSLTPSRTRVKNIVDSCLGEPARIVYIAPPYFGPKQQNPFDDNTQRFVAVKKANELLDMDAELAEMHKREGVIRLRREQKRKECLKAAGLPTRQHKIKSVMMGDGERCAVISDPPECSLFYAYDTDEFVRYNMGEKKNNAFYVRRDNPEVVFSFIPEEQPFLFRAADPQGYAEHVAKYGEGSAKVINSDTGEVRNVVREMFIEQTHDQFVTIEYDPENDELVDYQERRNAEVAKEWMKFHGRIEPDPVPPIWAIYDPTESRALYEKDGRQYVNTFRAPKFLKAPTIDIDHEPWMRYGCAFLLRRECPVICEVILNMLGDCDKMFEHFINWMAYIVQHKKKAETAFFVHGEQGTGKGLFHKRVVRPIFGRYTVMNTLENIADDKFNDWLAETLFCVVDEFNMRGSSSNQTKVGSKLKNYITEPKLQLRKMQVSMYEVDFFANFLFASNDTDAFTMHDKRRITMCPKQKRTLESRIETLKVRPEEFDDLIEEELPYFAGYLHMCKVNVQQAKSILVTSAREEVLEASMNAVDRFFDNLANGNFEPFLDLIDKPTRNLDVNEQVALTKIKAFLTANLEHINTGQPCYIHKDDIRLLYQYMSGRPVTDVRLGRMLSTHEIEQQRSYYAVGHPQKFIRRPKMIPVTWQMDDNDLVEQLKNEYCRGATSINKERDEKAEAEERAEAIKAEARKMQENR